VNAQDEFPFIMTGTANIESCRTAIPAPKVEWREGYCIGLIEAAMGVLSYQRVICKPAGATIAQGMRIVVSYMDRHAEYLHKPLLALTIVALSEAFPCRR
jgi:hypothetical protein